MYKVSVIIPIYNVEKYIERCINTLMNQSLDDVEYIFINDASTDKSIDILYKVIKLFPSKEPYIKVINHKKNRGIAAARNSGFDIASGEYIICCDSDDFVSPDIYKKMYEIAKKDDADIVYCDYYGVFNKKNIYYKQCSENINENFLRYILCGNIHNGLWNKLIKKEIWDKLDFLFVEKVNMWEDVSVLSRIAFFCKKVSYIPEALYYYNQTNVNAYTKKWSNNSVQNVISVISIVLDFYKKYNIPKEFIMFFILRAKSLLIIHSSNGEKERIRNIYSEANKYIFKYPDISFVDKINLWCTLNSLELIPIFIKRIKELIKNIIR